LANVALVTGGARSGKSRFAELLARSSAKPVVYIATAEVRDEEMAERIAKHRQTRPPEWRLIEEPRKVNDVLVKFHQDDVTILLDCVTLWLTNLLLTSEADGQAQREQMEKAILQQVLAVAHTAADIRPHVIFVTNEVGHGIVPDNQLARAYRDLAGRANQILAEAAEAVYLVVAGYPLEIKQPGQKLLARLTDLAALNPAKFSSVPPNDGTGHVPIPINLEPSLPHDQPGR